MPKLQRGTVRVTVAGGLTWTTEINGTEQEIRDYFKVGAEINVGAGGLDDVREIVSVELLPEGSS